MEGRAFPMVPSGDLSGPEHQLEGSNSNSTGIPSSRGDQGDRAQGTARAPKQRKARSKNWSDEQTLQLLKACFKFEENASTSKGRCRLRAPQKWHIISGSVNGSTADQCRRRMETLTKSFNAIQKYCVVHHKQFGQLTKEEFKRLKLACDVKSSLYDQMCKVKEQPENALEVSKRDPGKRRISSSPTLAEVMVGFFFSSLSRCALCLLSAALRSRGWEQNMEIMPD